MAIIKNVDRMKVPLDFLGRCLDPGEELYVPDKLFLESNKLQELILRRKIRVVEEPVSKQQVTVVKSESNAPDVKALAQQMAQEIVQQVMRNMPQMQPGTAPVAQSPGPLVEMDEKLVIVDKKEDFNANLGFESKKVQGKESLAEKARKLKALKGGGKE